jgi:hypothetical protein
MSSYLLPYAQGTISVENGSTAVVGAGTAWTNEALPGDWIFIDGERYTVAAVGGNTGLTLLEDYAGSTDSGISYAIHRVSRGWGDASSNNLRLAQIFSAVQRGFSMTSMTAVEIGDGPHEFIVPSGMPILPGARVLISSRADPSTHWILGLVTAYEGQTLTVAEESVGTGSGDSRSDWNINIAGARGPIGAAVAVPGSTTVGNLAGWNDASGGALTDLGSRTSLMAGPWFASTDVASAATCNIGAAPTQAVMITGTTTITSLGTVANICRIVRFAGALTLTHNGTSLILPGAVNTTTIAGETAIFASDASGNWRAVAYPPRWRPATDSVAGAVELSTDGEAITGTDTIRAITPANLAAVLLDILGGGTTGQALVKASDDPLDLVWVDTEAIEFGSWTPTIYGATTAGTQAYTVQYGAYEKRGNKVHAWGYAKLSSKGGTMAGSVMIGGLPYAMRNVANEYPISTVVVSNLDLAGSDRTPYALVLANTDTILMGQQGDNIGTAVFSAAAVGDSTGIFIDVTYYAA